MPEPTHGGVPHAAVQELVDRKMPMGQSSNMLLQARIVDEVQRDLKAAAPFFRKHFEEDLLSDEAVEAAGDAIIQNYGIGGIERFERDGKLAIEAALSISREGGR